MLGDEGREGGRNFSSTLELQSGTRGGRGRRGGGEEEEGRGEKSEWERGRMEILREKRWIILAVMIGLAFCLIGLVVGITSSHPTSHSPLPISTAIEEGEGQRGHNGEGGERTIISTTILFPTQTTMGELPSPTTTVEMISALLDFNLPLATTSTPLISISNWNSISTNESV